MGDAGPAQVLVVGRDLLRAVFLAGDRERGAPAVGNGSAPSSNGSVVRPTSTGPALQLQGVTRRFGGISAVEDVSIEVG